jgi:hypothetical protein
VQVVEAPQHRLLVLSADEPGQLARFAEEAVPAVREQVRQERAGG